VTRTDPEAAAEGAERVVVLGFDGVPWPLVSRWVEEGELPHFATLFEEGVAGPLVSTMPPTTPMAWPSIATGFAPDKHGIYGFHRLTPQYTHRMNTSDRLRVAPLWERIQPAAVGNVPMTYPATDIDGHLVAGMMAPAINDRFTSPSELATTIRKQIPDYRIGLKWDDYDGREEAFFEDLDAMIAARRTLMRHLMATEWRLLFFVYTAPDRLQHLVWDETVLLDFYRTFDDILGEVMQTVADGRGNLFVVSDHGFGQISRFAHVNTFLEREGYVERKQPTGSRRVLDSLGVKKSTVLDALERVGIDDETLVRYLPAPVVDAVASRIPGEHILHDVDFERTTAFLHGPGHVYVNDTERFDAGTVPPEERVERKRELMSTLSAWTDPRTGNQILDIYDGATLFPNDSFAPDVVVAGIDGYQVRMSLSSTPLVDTGDVAAYHRRDGVFFAWGHHVAADARLDDASVVDVAPTVLHSLGEPVPRCADGRVLQEVFAPGTEPSECTIKRTDDGTSEPDAESDEISYEAVEERLQGLGYLE
jgi:predicted AlkP superfamily phosphohydrolase/phosphomutase